MIKFAVLLGCLSLVSPSLRAEETTNVTKQLNGGYFLLHQLCEDEARVPLLLDIKHSPPELDDLAVRISKLAKATTADLEEMQASNPAIHFDQNPLPQIEQDFRASIKADKQHQLLWGTSNRAFVQAFLVAQIDASNYAFSITQVLAQQESSPKRSKTLAELSTKWGAIRATCFRLLAGS